MAEHDTYIQPDSSVRTIARVDVGVVVVTDSYLPHTGASLVRPSTQELGPDYQGADCSGMHIERQPSTTRRKRSR